MLKFQWNNENNGILMNTNLEVLAQVVDGNVAFVVVVERSEAVGKLVVFVARERDVGFETLLLQTETHLVAEEAHGVVVLRLLLLLTPLQLLAHQADDLGQRMLSGVHVDKGDARAPCDDVKRGACVLLQCVFDLDGNQS